MSFCLLFKINALIVAFNLLMGLVTVHTNRVWSEGKKPLPWADRPVVWLLGAFGVAVVPILNLVTASVHFYELVFNTESRREAAARYIYRPSYFGVLVE